MKLFRRSRDPRESPPYLRAGAFLIIFLIAIITLCLASFRGAFDPIVHATVVAERSGLVMEPGSKVKLHGAEVGRVESVSLAGSQATLDLGLEPSKLELIPANVEAVIAPTTVFGSKYVELVVTGRPASAHLSAGAQIRARNVSTEVNTVFQNVVSVMDQIEPDKLNAALSALSEGLRGRGDHLGETLTATDRFLIALNPVLPRLQADLQGTAVAAGNLSDAGNDLIGILRNATVTSDTIVTRRDDLVAALLSASELGRAGSGLLSENGKQLVDFLRLLTPTTALLADYSPSYACLLHLGVLNADDLGAAIDATNYSVSLDVGLLLGDDPYKYPENLPIVAGKGGPHGSPGCYAPVTWDNYPAPYLRINTGAPLNGPGTDHPRVAEPTILDYMFGFTLTGGGR
ncbi:MCE family protein [Nocardia sp. NBC_01388]|uniref:MCE family protein n=1 Tax=Nocardia sp. NBC_01388 TaxID=2903596 RepID=UPI0032463CB8